MTALYITLVMKLLTFGSEAQSHSSGLAGHGEGSTQMAAPRGPVLSVPFTGEPSVRETVPGTH